jgi:hypothetical protein
MVRGLLILAMNLVNYSMRPLIKIWSHDLDFQLMVLYKMLYLKHLLLFCHLSCDRDIKCFKSFI